jgi:hypothetical protein
MGCHMKRSFLLLAALILLVVPSIAKGETDCTIVDDEEYEVLAAMMFPNNPDIPDRMTSDLERKTYLSSVAVRLDGFHGGDYRLQDETTEAKSSDQTHPIDADFTMKNRTACRISKDKLMTHLPPGAHVSFANTDELRKAFSAQQRGEKGTRSAIPSEIAYLSRPGFNRDRNESMVDAGMKAGFEMGVGYRVYLKKSPKTGKWFIDGAKRTRTY